MSAAKETGGFAADPVYDARNFPVLRVPSRRWRGTLFGRTQPGLKRLLRLRSAPTTRRLQLVSWRSLLTAYYSKCRSAVVSLPLVVRRCGAALTARGRLPKPPRTTVREQAIFDAFYRETPVGTLPSLGRGVAFIRYRLASSLCRCRIFHWRRGERCCRPIPTRENAANTTAAPASFISPTFTEPDLAASRGDSDGGRSAYRGDAGDTDANGRWIPDASSARSYRAHVIKAPYASNCVAGIKTLRAARAYVRGGDPAQARRRRDRLSGRGNGTVYSGEAEPRPFSASGSSMSLAAGFPGVFVGDRENGERESVGQMTSCPVLETPPTSRRHAL